MSKTKKNDAAIGQSVESEPEKLEELDTNIREPQRTTPKNIEESMQRVALAMEKMSDAMTDFLSAVESKG